MSRTLTFKVTVETPEGVSRQDMREYIEDAVGGWKGGFHPENPLFDLDRGGVTVTQYRRANLPAAVHYFLGAQALLSEAYALLEEFEDNGLHHPVCDLRQRIGEYIAGFVPTEQHTNPAPDQ